MKRRRRRSRNPMDEYADYYEDDTPQPKRRKKQRDPESRLQLPPSLVHLLILAAVGLILLGLVWVTAGGPVLEKTLQALMAPLGLLWFGLFLVTYFCLLRKQGFPAFISFVCWMLLTIGGNGLVSALLVNSLQGQYDEFRIANAPQLDIVAVLGGGLMTTSNGEPQITDAGDRALLAWRLYQAGKVERIICTGTSGLPLAEGELTQADALEKILLSLGVPQDKIIKIGGRNTIQEIQALDKWLTENDAARLQKGIVTSAWHLPRAMRLAETVGISAEPLPADFSDTRIKASPDLLIPASANLHQVTLCIREYLAGLLGR